MRRKKNKTRTRTVKRRKNVKKQNKRTVTEPPDQDSYTRRAGNTSTGVAGQKPRLLENQTVSTIDRGEKWTRHHTHSFLLVTLLKSLLCQAAPLASPLPFSPAPLLTLVLTYYNLACFLDSLPKPHLCSLLFSCLSSLSPVVTCPSFICSVCLPTYLPTCPPAYLPACLPNQPFPPSSSCVPFPYLFFYLSVYLPSCLPP